MDNSMTFNHNLATVGWGALFVWWGVSILVGPITIGMCAIGTGLILLGLNAARALKGIPTKCSNVPLAMTAIVWGTLDTVFNPSLELSAAIMLIVVGGVVIASLLLHPAAASAQRDA